MAILKDLFVCTRPVFFENDNREYPYSFSGSSFVIFYRTDYYLFTLRHVLGAYHHDQVSILVNDENDQFIPFNLFSHPTYPDRTESDYGDVCVLRIDKNSLSLQQRNSLAALNLDEFVKHSPNLNSGDTLIFTGYPTHNRGIDYERRVLSWQRVSIEARYDKPYAEEHLHKIMIPDTANITSFDGFSGSPVLKIASTEDHKYDVRFAGILLRGSVEAKTAYFVDHIVIYNILNKIIAG
jgi:hypothetical protein